MNGTILVVAPDSAFRLSLRFMLETEGFDVLVPGTLEPGKLEPGKLENAMPLLANSDCMVMDTECLSGSGSAGGGFASRRSTVERFSNVVGRVVFLTDKPWEKALTPNIRVIEKPLLGKAVVNAVCQLLQGPQSSDAT